MATARRLEYVRLDELQRAPRNPKAHDEAGIAGSVGRHGFVEPVILDERTGRLVGGHGRLDHLQALRDAGADPPEGVLVDDDGAWQVPAVLGWASRSDADAEALLVALNRLPEAGGWDTRGLYDVLDQLSQDPGGLDGTGYTADDLNDLLASLGPAEPPPDAGPPPPTPSTRAGRREVQGLREVALTFQQEHHREYLEHLAKLKRAWGEDAAPLVVLRALREAARSA